MEELGNFVEIAIWTVEGREKGLISELDPLDENLFIGIHFNARVLKFEILFVYDRLKIQLRSRETNRIFS